MENEIILESHDSLDDKLARGDGSGLESDVSMEDENDKLWIATILEEIEQIKESIDRTEWSIEQDGKFLEKQKTLLKKKEDLLENNNF